MKREIMDWETCKREHIRQTEADHEKIKSILKMCSVRHAFLQKQEIDEETASIITEGYYEIVKELLTALLLKEGLKSDNHECLISYFKQKYPQHEYETLIMHELKNTRNRITYDGIFVKKSYLDQNKLEFDHIIKMLRELIEK